MHSNLACEVVARDWARDIKKTWRKGPASTLELARVVCAAKSGLPRGAWTALWKAGTKMPFSLRKAYMLVVIGDGLGWANVQTFAHLPTGWSILYQLATLDQTTLERLIESGEVHPELKLWQARQFAAQFRGETLGPSLRKRRVHQRLQRFCEFVHDTVCEWDPEERALATAKLTLLLERINTVDGIAFRRNNISTTLLTRLNSSI